MEYLRAFHIAHSLPLTVVENMLWILLRAAVFNFQLIRPIVSQHRFSQRTVRRSERMRNKHKRSYVPTYLELPVAPTCHSSTSHSQGRYQEALGLYIWQAEALTPLARGVHVLCPSDDPRLRVATRLAMNQTPIHLMNHSLPIASDHLPETEVDNVLDSGYLPARRRCLRLRQAEEVTRAEGAGLVVCDNSLKTSHEQHSCLPTVSTAF